MLQLSNINCRKFSTSEFEGEDESSHAGAHYGGGGPEDQVTVDH